MNYGLHTFEVFIKISKDLFNTLFDILEQYAVETNCNFIPYPNNKKWLEFKLNNKATKRTWTLYPKENGLNISLLKTFDFDKELFKFKNYYLRYIITPYHLLNGNHFNIYTEDNFIYVCNKVDEIIGSISALLHPMENMKIRRIDFCHNIFCNNQNEVHTYIEVFKKYHLYKGYKLYYEQDKNGNDYPHDICTTLENGDIELCIYDKHFEMSSKPNVYTKEETESYLNCLRIELRIERDKIKIMEHKFGVESNIEFLNQAIMKTQEYFDFYLKKLFHSGDYHFYDKSIDIIEESKCTPKTKLKLKKLIYYVSKHGSLHNGIISIRKDYKKHQIDNLLKQLDLLNLNPCTISRRKCEESNIDYLPNLINYFSD